MDLKKASRLFDSGKLDFMGHRWLEVMAFKKI
jgi:hypothetical protein